jgi:uncharacterized protein (TIGR03083 family)
MPKTDVWPVVHAERKALAADLGGLRDDQWDQPSLCGDWTVRDVLAHMTATAEMSGPRFFVKIVGSGFSLARLQNRDIARVRGATPGDTLAAFERQVETSGGPPGPAETMLGETIVHAEDIRRPLGIAHVSPLEAVARVADFYASSNLVIGGKRRVAGLALRATDTDWSHGDGPTVSGPVLSIVLAMTGRAVALDDLEGDGVAQLRARMP